MVGGTVIETIDLPNKVWVNCRDGKQECAVFLERTSKARCISEGDQLWWQNDKAMWTPASMGDKEESDQGEKWDIQLQKIGPSGVPRPEIPSAFEKWFDTYYDAKFAGWTEEQRKMFRGHLRDAWNAAANRCCEISESWGEATPATIKHNVIQSEE